MTTHSRILAWRIPWRAEEPDGLQSMGSQRVRHDSATNTQDHSSWQHSSGGPLAFSAVVLMEDTGHRL